MKIAGIDIGFGDVKVVSDELMDGNDGIMVSFPSLVAFAQEESFRLDDREAVPVQAGNKKYYVGEDARKSDHQIDLKFRDWIKEDEYIALYKKALTFIQPGNHTVVTGLPVSEFKACRDDLKKRLLGEFKINGNTYNVADVKVMPQPFGSFFNYALKPDGSLADNNGFSESIGIIDIGFRTSDFILVEAGRFKEDGSSGTIENAGVSNLIDRLKVRIDEAFGVELPVMRVREALKTKEIKAYGEMRSISQMIDEEAAVLARLIVNRARTYWKSGGHIDTLLLVGGGAEIFRPYIEKAYRHSVVSRVPAFSNSIGYWKYGKAKA